MAVTLKDVASKAGVSPVVVSHVLHGRVPSIRVSEATAERVRAAAKELGYRLNVYARNFRQGQTKVLGVLHGLGFGRPMLGHGSRYFAALMDGLIEGAFEHGYSVTLCPKLLGDKPETAMQDGRFDGLIWYSTMPTPTGLRIVKNCSVPMVLVHARAKDFANEHPTVGCNNDEGVGLAMRHLVELGHRKIGYIVEGEIINSEAIRRHEAFRKHATLCGVSTDDKDLIGTSGSTDELERYFANGPTHTAFLANHDGLAAKTLDIAKSHGYQCPRDFSVIGFDSTSFCLETRPTLTSIHQPLEDIGRQAIELLLEVIAGNPPDPFEVVLPCRLDVRESTGPVPSHPTKGQHEHHATATDPLSSDEPDRR